jgi:hypothetical protein
MRQVLKASGVVVIIIALGLAFASGWWSLWMDHGWPGPTGLLAKMIHADGERYYDAIFDEMWIWAFLLLSLVALVWWRISGRRAQAR